MATETKTTGQHAEELQFEGGNGGFFGHAYRQGWTDGLPVVKPTHERVETLLLTCDRDPSALIGYVPPRWGELTVERAAINAVMAGCRPEYFPIVVAAADAILDDAFNLYGVQATTNPVSPTIIVNGPIAPSIEMNSGTGCLGPGARANMTIGRAIRLILRNPGGGEPGRIDRATQGYPGKLSLCFAENEAKSPWDPFHVDQGFSCEDSTVTVYQGTGTFNILDAVSSKPIELLRTIAHSLRGIGSNNMQLERGEALVIMCPEHAEILNAGGFTKKHVQRFLWSTSTVSGTDFPTDMRDLLLLWRQGEFAAIADDTVVPLTRTPEDLVVVVAGGAGPHSCFVPGFSDGRMITRSVATEDPDG